MIKIATLRAAGLSAEQIVAVLEKHENERFLSRREQNRKNQQNHRSRQQKRDDCADIADGADPPPMVSPITSSLTSPSPSSLRSEAIPTRADLEREFFQRGKQVLGKNAGGMLSSLLKAKSFDIAQSRAVIETASTKQDAREYVGAVIRNAGNGGFRWNGIEGVI